MLVSAMVLGADRIDRSGRRRPTNPRDPVPAPARVVTRVVTSLRLASALPLAAR
jgi:hypothetical protein